MQNRNFSIAGLIAASIHLLFVALVFLYVKGCSGMFCQAGILLAVLPWFPLFDEVKLPIDGYVLFWTLVLIDTALLYLLFAFLEKWLGKR